MYGTSIPGNIKMLIKVVKKTEVEKSKVIDVDYHNVVQKYMRLYLE